MIKLWSLIPSNIKIWVILAGVSLLIASYAYTFYSGVTWQRDRQEIKTITKTITIREKQNEIRDNRPSVTRTVTRLLNNSF